MDPIISSLPAKYVTLATVAWVLIQTAGRAWHAWTNNGGWRGIKNGLLFGTNVENPKETAAIETAQQQKEQNNK